jgi:hypothetical protein
VAIRQIIEEKNGKRPLERKSETKPERLDELTGAEGIMVPKMFGAKKRNSGLSVWLTTGRNSSHPRLVARIHPSDK